MQSIDLNCDMGESIGTGFYDTAKDIALMQYVSSINLACGYHAGDAHTMHALVEAALKKGIAIGAHPSFPDKENFGRKNMSLSPEKVYDIVLFQIGALYAFVKVYGSRLHHVKPHGALYNMAAKDRTLADAICKAVSDFDDSLVLYGLAGSALTTAAASYNLRTAAEVFADRTYLDDGSLTPRTQANAMIEDKHLSLQQILQMVQQGTVKTITGRTISLKAETICIHGDGDQALTFAANIYHGLVQQQISITPF